ncbi:MAG: hypothetical protein WEC80_02110 [Patescibacteria group bacterium]
MSFLGRFIDFSLITAIVFYISYLFFDRFIVFGNVLSNPAEAIVMTSLIVGFVSSIIVELSKRGVRRFSPNTWMLIYWAAITLTIYFLARTQVSEKVGIGIVAFWVAIIIGFVVHLGHYSLGHHNHLRKR